MAAANAAETRVLQRQQPMSVDGATSAMPESAPAISVLAKSLGHLAQNMPVESMALNWGRPLLADKAALLKISEGTLSKLLTDAVMWRISEPTDEASKQSGAASAVEPEPSRKSGVPKSETSVVSASAAEDGAGETRTNAQLGENVSVSHESRLQQLRQQIEIATTGQMVAAIPLHKDLMVQWTIEATEGDRANKRERSKSPKIWRTELSATFLNLGEVHAEIRGSGDAATVVIRANQKAVDALRLTQPPGLSVTIIEVPQFNPGGDADGR